MEAEHERSMKIEAAEIEKEICNYIDEVKELLSPEVWENVLLDCTKNELLILWLLYRRKEVNMSQIAEYIHVPLNTATGIIARMEKRSLVIRERSREDKRIVTIALGEQGSAQLRAIMQEMSYYIGQIVISFSQEELQNFFIMLQKMLEILKHPRKRTEEKSKVRKITIE